MNHLPANEIEQPRIPRGERVLLDCNGARVLSSSDTKVLDLSFTVVPWCVDCRSALVDAAELDMPHNLSTLVMGDLGLARTQTERVCRHVLRHSPELLTLVLDRNTVDEGCLRVLCKAKHLSRLDMEGAIRVGDDGRVHARTAGALARTIRDCGLHHVQLSYNAPFIPSALPALARGSTCATLRSMALASCGIDDTALGHIARICGVAHHLEFLELSRNRLTLRRVPLWPPTKSILTLDISLNPLRASGCRALIASILPRTCNLKCLRMQGCDVEDAVEDVHGLLSGSDCAALETVDLRDNVFHYGHRLFLRDGRILCNKKH